MTAHYAYILKTDGTLVTVDEIPTLEIMQKAVQGNIQMLNIQSEYQYYCNEDGIHLSLEKHFTFPQILGNIFIVNEVEDSEEWYEPFVFDPEKENMEKINGQHYLKGGN